MSYPIEIRPASKNGWHTPAEARSYYGRYDRNGVTVHWWNTPSAVKDSDHDNIVNYILGKANAGTGSVNYVLSNNKISLLVSPDNVAWASQAGNPTTVSVEFSPHLNDEGYKKAGWLINELEGRYGRSLQLFPHNHWFQTSCPGHLSLDRMRQEANKWKSGGYNPAPPTPPPPATASIEWIKLPTPIVYVTNKQPTKLWNFNQTSWSGFGNGVKDYNKGDKITVYGQAINKTLNATYLVTEYSFTKKITNGFNVNDMDVYVAPLPVPNPVPDPVPEPPAPPLTPEWERNLRDIDDTKMWVKEETNLIDIKTGNAIAPIKTFHVNDEFVASALTISNGVEYRITDYSFKKKIFNGVPIGKLTLTAPGVSDIPPVPEDPDLIKKSVVAEFLEGLVTIIRAFINKLKE